MKFTDEQIEEMLRAYSLDYPPSWEGLRTVAEHAAQLEREAIHREAMALRFSYPATDFERGVTAGLHRIMQAIRARGEETE